MSIKANSGDASSLLSTLLIVIIPKCPWCIIAYSSAITMCGVEGINHSSTNWISYLPIVFSLLITLMIFINRRSKRTWLSGLISVIGLILIIAAHQNYLPKMYFDVGAGIQFLAIWYNGNLLFFVNVIQQYFKKYRTAWQR